MGLHPAKEDLEQLQKYLLGEWQLGQLLHKQQPHLG